MAEHETVKEKDEKYLWKDWREDCNITFQAWKTLPGFHGDTHGVWEHVGWPPRTHKRIQIPHRPHQQRGKTSLTYPVLGRTDRKTVRGGEYLPHGLREGYRAGDYQMGRSLVYLFPRRTGRFAFASITGSCMLSGYTTHIGSLVWTNALTAWKRR